MAFIFDIVENIVNFGDLHGEATLTLRDPRAWEGVFGIFRNRACFGRFIESISRFYFGSFVTLLLSIVLNTCFIELYLAAVEGRFLNLLDSVIDGLLILRFLLPISTVCRPAIL